MSTETQALELAPIQPGEPPMRQLAPYDEFKAKIENLKKTAETITVTDISQTAEMKIARATRLSLREIRIAITHRHTELKADILKEGRKIDDGKNQLLAILEPLELRLKDQEDFVERETARIQAEKRTARVAELTPLLPSNLMTLGIDLGRVTDDEYAAMLTDAKDAHTARLAREQKEKEEAAAKLKAEAEERERARLELERLKKEAEARVEQDRKDAAERKRVATIEDCIQAIREGETDALRICKTAEDTRLEIEYVEASEITAEIFQERQAEAEKVKAEVLKSMRAILATREAAEQAEAKAEAERQRVAAEQAAAAEKARKEREAIEKKAKAERDAAAKKAAAELAETQRKAREAQAAADAKAKAERESREKAEAKLREWQAADEAKRKAAAEAEQKAKRAPDKEKLLALLEALLAVSFPEMATDEGKTVLADITHQFDALISQIQVRAQSL